MSYREDESVSIGFQITDFDHDPGYDQSRWVPSEEAAIVRDIEGFLGETNYNQTSAWQEYRELLAQQVREA